MKIKKIFAFIPVLVLGILAMVSCTKPTYTITWKNWDGTILELDQLVEEGSLPIYNGQEPTKESDAQYTYTFEGWDKEIQPVTGNITYTANFSSIVNTYTVTWQNWDGTILATHSYFPYGVTPNYIENTPTKESDAQYTYTFSGWEPEIQPVTGDITYTAQFNSTIQTYSVTWMDWDGTVLEYEELEYGSTPVFNGETPTIESTSQYQYYFLGWDKEIQPVTGNITYTALYVSELNTYTVTWKNWDGTILEIDNNVQYGTIAHYNEQKPTKEPTIQYTYIFSGWDKEIQPVTGDVIYTAQFDTIINTYTVTWVNWDGSVLEKDENVEYGIVPTYNTSAPTKESTAQYTYTFIGWDKEVAQVTGDVTYTAQFSATINTYTIIWENWDGTILEIDQSVEYGEMPNYNGLEPTKESDAQYTYTFSGWNKEINEVIGHETYVAQFNFTINTYTVTWENWDGTILEQDEDVLYGELPTFDSLAPTKESDIQYTYSFIGWDKEVIWVTGDITYTAQYSFTINSYIVRWENYDGTLLEEENVAYGTMPVYKGSTPEKAREPIYEYKFIGWNPAVEEVTGNATYIALFEQIECTTFIIKYELNGGSGELYNIEKAKGEETSISAISPTKEGYIFVGWNNIYEDKTYYPGETLNLDLNFTLYAIWEEQCSACEGTGQIDTRWSCSSCSGEGYEKVFVQCSACRGLGSQMTLECQSCGYTKLHYGLSGSGPTGGLTCPQCYGRNWYYYDVELCSYCDGTRGQYASRLCSQCNGEGKGGDIYDCTDCNKTGIIRIDAPSVESKKYNQIILVKIEGYQYSMDGVNWQDSNIFEGLHSCTTYTFYQRVATKDGVPFGTTSYPLSVETPAAPVYNIEYVLNGGSATNEITYTIESNDIILSAPIKEGYTFVGWVSSDILEPTKEVIIPTGSTGHRTYTAVWEANTYTITYILGEGTNSQNNPIAYTTDSETIIFEEPTKEHFVFKGWFMDEEFSKEIVEIQTGTHQDYTLYAKWELYNYKITYMDGEEKINTSFTVSFDSTGGTEVERQIISYVDELKYPKNPTKSGYYFKGWYLNLDDNEPYDFSQNITKDVTLYAKWHQAGVNYRGYTYPLLTNHYNKNTTVYSIDCKYYVNYSDCYQAFVALASGEYRFYSEGSANSSYIEVRDEQFNFIKEASNNYDFTLHLEAGELIYLRYFANQPHYQSSTGVTVYSIKINIDGPDPLEGGRVILCDEYTYETPTFQLNGHEKEGYKFDGWFSEPTLENEVIEIHQGSSTNYILYAKWEIVDYTLSYELDGGELSQENPKTYNIESEDILLSNPTKIGHTFLGWISKINSTPTKDCVLSSGNIGNITFTAVWDVNKHNVIWQNYDGTILEIDSDAEYGKKPTYDGYTPIQDGDAQCRYEFVGWDSEVVEVTGDVTYVAQFEKHYFIFYHLNEGVNHKENPADYTAKSELITLKAPTRIGYTFIGWTGTNGDVPELEISFDGNDFCYREYTANWRLTVFKVEYVMYDGTNHLKNPNELTILDTFNLKEPTKTGYTFDGWYLDEDFSQQIETLQNVATDITLYAKFVPNQYSAKFIKDSVKIILKVEGFLDKTYTLEYGETFDPYSYDVMANYLSDEMNSQYAISYFLGWKKDSKEVKGTITVTNDTILIGEFFEPKDDYYNYCTYYSSDHNCHMGTGFTNPRVLPTSVKWYSSQYGWISDISSTGTCVIHYPPLASNSITLNFKLYYAGVRIKKNGTEILSAVRNYNTTEYDSITIKGAIGDHIEIYTYSNGTNGRALCEISIDRRTSEFVSKNDENKQYYYDEFIQLPAHEKEGYNFKWIDENGQEITQSWNYTQDKVFRAEYSLKEYQINYVLDGSTNDPNNPSTYTIKESIILKNPIKKGYTFKGWYTNSNFTGRITSIINKTGDYTLYAKFEANSYIGTLDLNGGIIAPKLNFVSNGEVVNSLDFTEESSLLSYYPPEREGFIFGGWYIDEACTNVFDFTGIIANDLTLYAKWIESDLMNHQITDIEVEKEYIEIDGTNERQITFVPLADGTITISTESQLDLSGTLYDQNGSKVAEADDISDENFNFSITHYVYAGQQYTIGIKGVTTLTNGDCEVLFDFEDDIGIKGTTYTTYSINAIYDSTFELPSPIKEGSEFVGWFDEEGEQVYISCWKYEDCILHARWN